MPDYLKYQKSVSNELISIKDRVRNFIDDRHWGEDGRYKEVILRNVLIRYLPQNVSVGTGFVVDENREVSTQIDIIIYANTVPPMFLLDDFVVVAKESVLGIIEVKTNIRNAEFGTTIKKAHNNGMFIGNQIFNGVFGYEAALERRGENLKQNIEASLKRYNGYVNNICFGKDLFAKYWRQGQPRGEEYPHYSFYDLEDLSFGYFISNLVEDIQIQLTNKPITNTLQSYLYPIEGTKEVRRLNNYEIRLTTNWLETLPS